MPSYVYRAITADGHIVKNRIEETNKYAVLKKLKRNSLTPISVTELRRKKSNTKKNKRNVRNVDSMIKNLNSRRCSS